MSTTSDRFGDALDAIHARTEPRPPALDDHIGFIPHKEKEKEKNGSRKRRKAK